MVMDRFTIDNEGTYTVQIQDGKAKNQSSLVLIGDGKFIKHGKFQWDRWRNKLQLFLDYFCD